MIKRPCKSSAFSHSAISKACIAKPLQGAEFKAISASILREFKDIYS
jgi:hypothetical protein